MKVGASIAIIHNGRVLLTKRHDFAVWCLPGGHVDAGESVAQAAIREILEETGLEVRLTRLVGIYSIPQARAWCNLIILFTGEPVGGALKAQQDEVLEMDYFSPHEIPENLLWGHRQRILDAFDGRGGSAVWTQNVPFDPFVDRHDLYRMVDESGLTGMEFYARNFGWNVPTGDHKEFG
jgi:ADP-ribose pyrophosphatase YjhB (NUDIX family)